MKYFGIKHFDFNSFDTLKREYLYFDTLYYEGSFLETILKEYIILHKLTDKESETIKFIEAEINYLTNKGILKELNFSTISFELVNSLDKNPFYKNLSDDGVQSFLATYSYLKILKESSELLRDKQKKSISSLETVVQIQLEYIASKILEFELWIRLNCQLLPALKEYHELFIPVVSDISALDVAVPNRKSEVLEIVINKFPVPDDSISWEELEDFKLDPSSQEKLLAFKAWAIKISHTKYNKTEIEQELEYLLNEYENQMKLHKMKYKIGNLELLITTGMEILENLVKLNFGKASKILFDFKKRHLDLLIAETKVTGRELAYISKAKEKFVK